MFGTPMVAGKYGLMCRFLAFLFLFLIFAGGIGQRVISQNLPVPNASIAEEQDYAFAHGLYRDGLFQIAAEQFQRFAEKHPQSVRVQDAQFLKADCLFQRTGRRAFLPARCASSWFV